MLLVQEIVLLQRQVAVVVVHHGRHWRGAQIKHGGTGGAVGRRVGGGVHDDDTDIGEAEMCWENNTAEDGDGDSINA